ncbi:MAG TPA: DUF4235 domain-containing protein [Solirubrobacteraceae bacterium]|nr:DUF4235 domain-containing protein [Solirubrobacteraceae bacterium]
MAKVIFTPVSIVAGLLAGIIGKKLFRLSWGLVDEEEPPRAQHHRINVGKLALALALEGAVFRVVKGLADHGSRRGFNWLTGLWPGEEAPQAD